MTFSPAIYQQRRTALRSHFDDGIVLLLGAVDSPMNCKANNYFFVQDACFRYFFGLNQPGLAGLIDLESGEDILFGGEPTLDDVIWHGDLPTLAERGALIGTGVTRPIEQLEALVSQARRAGRKVHYLPHYRAEAGLRLAQLLGVASDEVGNGVSVALIRNIVAPRECKGPEEVAEIERALDVTACAHLAAMTASRPGVMEYDVVGIMEGIFARAAMRPAYPIIFSRRGEVLHNLQHAGELQRGDLVINDAGATSALGYASDVTRTLPVGGRFNDQQRNFYELVLAAQQDAIGALRPGVAFLDVHKRAASTLTKGLIAMGLLVGDPDELVEDGVHSILFQSGLGHQLGLDVHDMEALGEDHVGYGNEMRRSAQFGLNHLRMAKSLRSSQDFTLSPH